MKLTSGMLLAALVTGGAFAQSPAVVQNTKTALQTVQQKPAATSAPAKAASKPSAQGPAMTTAAPGKPAPVAAKPVASAPAKAAPVVASKPATTPAKPAAAPVVASKPAAAPAKLAVAQAPAKPAVAVKPVSAPANKTVAAPKPAIVAMPVAVPAKAVAAPAAKAPAVKNADDTKNKVAEAQADKAEKDAAKKEQSYVNANGRRDPFVSPVVQHMGGSGCNTGKRCLAVDQISLRGIVRSEAGMIAVVVNALDKAYFLRENDPVFNGYVMKINGDSVVFKETVQDKLGHTSTREVVKKITTPAV